MCIVLFFWQTLLLRQLHLFIATTPYNLTRYPISNPSNTCMAIQVIAIYIYIYQSCMQSCMNIGHMRYLSVILVSVVVSLRIMLALYG